MKTVRWPAWLVKPETYLLFDVMSAKFFRRNSCIAMVMFIAGLLPALAVPAHSQVAEFEAIEKIDVHVHIFDDLPEWVEMLKRIDTKVVNICVGASQPGLMEMCEQRAEQLHRQYGDLVRFAATFDLTRRQNPDYPHQVAVWLDSAFHSGAIMVKLWKEVGMSLKKPDGSFLMPDDPIFDPIYADLARQQRPLMTHMADPVDAWLPLDPRSPHYHYYLKNPEWHLYGKSGYPTLAEILAARDRVLERHPELIMVAAHLGSETHDLEQLAARFDRFPNLFADVAARTLELQRLPAETVRRFFIRFQDRLLYGTDSDKYTAGRLPTPAERTAFAESMERMYRQEYRYYAGQGEITIGKNKVACLHLPAAVLKKFYHQNARKLLFRAHTAK
jgi:predicted TIM-barrel fold metal-dependent hydrolase